MNVSEVKPLEWLAKFFGHIPVEDVELFLVQGIKAVIVLVLSYLFYKVLLKLIHRHFENDNLAVLGYDVLCRYLFLSIGVLTAIHIAGINLSTVFTTGGMLAIAAGFALRGIAENYFGGMVIRSEGTIKIGDVLEVDGRMVRVKYIGIRSTIVRTRDGSNIMIPNLSLINEKITNCTLRDSLYRVSTTIGVSYASDLKKVREVLRGVCDQLDRCSSRRAPTVLLTDFNNSSANYQVCVWIDAPWDTNQIKSNLNEAIWWALKDEGIVIAFPQLDLHFDENVRQL